MTHEERKAALAKINVYEEDNRRRPLIERGWICNHPEVKAVWFVGYLPRNETKEAQVRLEILFENMARHSIDQREVAGMEGDVEELLAQKGDEYLRNGGKGIAFNIFMNDLKR